MDRMESIMWFEYLEFKPVHVILRYVIVSGVKFTPNGWYIRVKEVLRDPNASDTHFYDRKGQDTPYTFDAESVVAGH